MARTPTRLRRRVLALAVAGLAISMATPLSAAAGDTTTGAGWVADTASYWPGLPSALGSLGGCTGESWSTVGVLSGGGVVNTAGQGYPPAPMSVAISGSGCETLIGGTGTASVTLHGRVLSSALDCGFSVVYTRLGGVLEIDSAPGTCVIDGYTTAPTFFSLRAAITPVDLGTGLGTVHTVAIAGAWDILPTSGPL